MKSENEGFGRCLTELYKKEQKTPTAEIENKQLANGKALIKS